MERDQRISWTPFCRRWMKRSPNQKWRPVNSQQLHYTCCSGCSVSILQRTTEKTVFVPQILDAFVPRRECRLRDANMACMSTVAPCPPKVLRLSILDLSKMAKCLFNNLCKSTRSVWHRYILFLLSLLSLFSSFVLPGCSSHLARLCKARC